MVGTKWAGLAWAKSRSSVREGPAVAVLEPVRAPVTRRRGYLGEERDEG